MKNIFMNLRRGVIAAAAIITTSLSMQSAASAIDIDIPLADFGYGDYVITMIGEGYNGAYDEDSVLFHYYPLALEVTEDEDTGKYYANLTYDNADDGVTSDIDIAKIVLNVYDANGNIIPELSPIVVTPPDTKVNIPITETSLPSGEYRVAATAYSTLGEELYSAYITKFTYTSLKVPDTGGPFRGVDISKIDYLATSLTFFGLFIFVGLVIIAKKDKNSSKKRVSASKRRK